MALLNLSDGGPGVTGYSTYKRVPGKPLSTAHRIAISEGLKRYERTAEHQANISAALVGRAFSPEHIEHLRGRIPSEETRQKISAANTGQARTTDQRIRMSKAQEGRVISLEHRQKIKETLQTKYTVCLRGHAMAPDNVLNLKNGKRLCRECHRWRAQQWRLTHQKKETA